MKNKPSIPKQPSQNSSIQKHKIQSLTMLALFTALALMIHFLESLLLPVVPIPGIKLGLANVVTLIVLERHGFREAALVLCCRILLAGFFFGQAIGLAYSIAGGFLCLLVMALFHRLLGKNYLTLTSIPGAIAHNLAQLAVACLITKTLFVLSYLPFLMLSAIVTGAFTGLCAHFSLRSLPAKFR